MRIPPWLLLCAAGCASGAIATREDARTDVVKTTIAPQETIDLTRETTIYVNEYAVTRAQVWTALLAAADAIGMPVRSADSTAGVVVYYVQAMSQRIAGRPASAWVDCGRSPAGGARADTYQITLRLTAVLEPDTTPHETRVRTMLVAFARDRSMSASGLPCTSTGALERRALAVVAARLSP